METKRKKQLFIDLGIILIITCFVLAIYIIFGDKINAVAYDTSINIVLRVLFVGVCFQFGIAGLGISAVAVYRQESFASYGLNGKRFFLTILLTVLCCVPDFIHNWVTGAVHPWFPFSDVNFTAEVVRSSFPYNCLGMLIIAICWGFFEGFNYVVIADKISELSPSKHKLWDWGAFICAVMCILIHGVIGVTPNEIVDMLCTMFLIYGMLLVRKKTGNAWGCVLLFILYWNAI